MALTNKLTAIADGFRQSRGTTEKLSLDEMAVLASEPVGGGGGDAAEVQAMLDGLIDGTVTEITTNATKIGNYGLMGKENMQTISMPNVTSIGINAFYSCSNLALTSLPSGVTSIGNYGFYNCSNLALTSLPSGLTSIGRYAFQNCTSLTNITFKGKPSSIYSSTFKECTNLTTINVPWAEGEVANAPWGATNATINYNYTGA